MNEVIQLGEATGARARMYFRLISTADNVTGKHVVTTGIKAQLSKNGAAAAASTNDIVEIDQTNQLGEYYVELTPTESNTLGTVVLNCQPAGCLTARGQATIFGYDPFTAGADENAIADALLDRTSAIDGRTVRGALKLILARMLGQQSGLNTTVATAKAIDGSKTRVTGTDDGAGGVTFVVDDT